jgi:hypothetical protein
LRKNLPSARTSRRSSSPRPQEIRSLCTENSVIAKGRLVFTGQASNLGADLDSFEERFDRAPRKTMMQLAKRLSAWTAFVALLSILAPTAVSAISGGSAMAKFKRVMIVVLENTSFEDAMKQPFLSSLSVKGAVLANFTAETHPSQPNYIALISGTTFGVNSDKEADLNARHIGDLLEAKGLQWKVCGKVSGNCPRHATGRM